MNRAIPIGSKEMRIKYHKNGLIHSGGFTMIEVIAVIVIIGIIAAVAIAKITSVQSYSVLMEADILKMNLRYAQIRALGDDANWGVSFGGNSYTLLRNGVAAPYNFPNEDSPTHRLPNGFNVNGTTVTFDEWGSPGTSPIVINISAAGETRVITITQNTGFIP